MEADRGTSQQTSLDTRSVAGDLARVALPKAIAGVLLFAVNVAVANALAPGTYAIFALAFTCVLLADAIVSPSLDLRALSRAARQPITTVTSIEQTTLRIKVIAGGAGLAVASAIGPLAGPWFNLTPGEGFATALAIAASSVALLLVRSAQVRLQLEHRLSRYGASELIQAAGRATMVAALLTVGIRQPFWLVAAGGVASGLTAVVIWPRALRRQSSRASVDPVLRKAIGITALTCVIGALGARLDQFVLGAVAPLEQLGVYSAALLPAMVFELAGAYLAPALQSRVMPLWRDGHLRRFVARVQVTLWLLAAVLFTVAWFAAPSVCTRLFSAEYVTSGPIARIVVLAGLSGLIIFPVALTVILMRAPHLFLWIDGLSLVALIPLWVWAAREYGAFGVAVITSSWRVFKAIVVTWVAVHLADASAQASGQAFTCHETAIGGSRVSWDSSS